MEPPIEARRFRRNRGIRPAPLAAHRQIVRHPDQHMISFVHIANKDDEQSIVKSGVRSTKRRTGPRGVYAVPVVPNYAMTHQWARELKRTGIRTLICVQFKV